MPPLIESWVLERLEMQSPSSPPSWIAPWKKPAAVVVGAGPPGEVSGCLALVPEAACGLEVTAGLGTYGWLRLDRLSLGGLL